MKVQVMSRYDATLYCMEEHDNSSVIISISDPSIRYTYEPFISSNNNVKDILKLWFCDATEPGLDVYNQMVCEYDLYSREQADQVARLVLKHLDKDIVIVHCDAGISRSSGLAAGILQALNMDTSQIFRNTHYSPNLRCFAFTAKAIKSLRGTRTGQTDITNR